MQEGHLSAFLLLQSAFSHLFLAVQVLTVITHFPTLQLFGKHL